MSDKWYMRITHHERHVNEKNNLGYEERLRHLEMLKSGAECYLVMCVAKDPEATPREIASFNKREIFIGGRVIESDGDWWIEMLERKPVGAVSHNQSLE